MTTLSPEEHHALDVLCNRINGKEIAEGWYYRKYSEESNEHTWVCCICWDIIHVARYLANSGTILFEHGINHLKQHNLLPFI